MILRLFIYTPVSYFRAGSNNRCRAVVLRDPWSTAEGAVNCWLFDSPTTARTRDLRITIGDEIGAVYDVTSCALNACPLTSRLPAGGFWRNGPRDPAEHPFDRLAVVELGDAAPGYFASR